MVTFMIYIQKRVEKGTSVTSSGCGEIWWGSPAVSLSRGCCVPKATAACGHSRHGSSLLCELPSSVRSLIVSRIWFIAVIEPCRECTDCMLLWQEYPKCHYSPPAGRVSSGLVC